MTSRQRRAKRGSRKLPISSLVDDCGIPQWCLEISGLACLKILTVESSPLIPNWSSRKGEKSIAFWGWVVYCLGPNLKSFLLFWVLDKEWRCLVNPKGLLQCWSGNHKKGITFWESLYTFSVLLSYNHRSSPFSCLPGLWAGKDQSSAFSSSNSIWFSYCSKSREGKWDQTLI